MIARKITYRGNFDDLTAGKIYDITRKNEITGEVRRVDKSAVVLDLEGDPAMIKLIQHQVERAVGTAISEKVVEPMPYRYFQGVTFTP